MDEVSELTLPEVSMDNHEVTGAAREAAGKVEKHYGRAKESLSNAAEDLAEKANINKEQISGTAREYTGKAERAYGNLKQRVSQTADELAGVSDRGRYAVQDSWNNAMALVQDNPGAAVGISFLVGAGIGALLSALADD
jgi:uncharacterized protein YjbJ (UPF0337 family)